MASWRLGTDCVVPCSTDNSFLSRRDPWMTSFASRLDSFVLDPQSHRYHTTLLCRCSRDYRNLFTSFHGRQARSNDQIAKMPDVAHSFTLSRLSPIASGSITPRSDVADASSPPAGTPKTSATGGIDIVPDRLGPYNLSLDLEGCQEDADFISKDTSTKSTSTLSYGTPEAISSPQFSSTITRSHTDIQRNSSEALDPISKVCAHLSYTPPLATDMALQANLGENQVPSRRPSYASSDLQ